MVKSLKPLTFALLLLFISLPISTINAEESWYGPLDRDWSLRLIGGAFKPAIDTQFDGASSQQALPYQDFFGTQKPTLFTFGMERFLSNLGGGVSIGLSLGYWSVEGTLKSASSDQTTSETTELVLYPLALEASYYLDAFAHSFPLIPFARIGADYCVWDILDGAGETSAFVYETAEGTVEYEAFGATRGWHYSIGVQFLLDGLDAKTADAFERDAGVKNTYLGLEFKNAQIDDLGSATSLRLGGKSVSFGLFIDL